MAKTLQKIMIMERFYLIYMCTIVPVYLLAFIFDKKLAHWLPTDAFTYYACIGIFIFTFSFTCGYLGSPLSPEDLGAFSVAIGIAAGIVRNRSHKTIHPEST